MGGGDAVATPVAVHGAHSPVDADGAQVEDAGGAHHHVERDEDVTVEPAEEPGAADHLRGRQGTLITHTFPPGPQHTTHRAV